MISVVDTSTIVKPMLGRYVCRFLQVLLLYRERYLMNSEDSDAAFH